MTFGFFWAVYVTVIRHWNVAGSWNYIICSVQIICESGSYDSAKDHQLTDSANCWAEPRLTLLMHLLPQHNLLTNYVSPILRELNWDNVRKPYAQNRWYRALVGIFQLLTSCVQAWVWSLVNFCQLNCKLVERVKRLGLGRAFGLSSDCLSISR